jgi:hypothetical protein
MCGTIKIVPFNQLLSEVLMAFGRTSSETAWDRLRAYSKGKRLSFEVSYILASDALKADNRQPTKVHPNPPVEADLSSEDQAALAAARSELGIGG